MRRLSKFYQDERERGVTLSVMLHLCVLIAVAFGLPNFLDAKPPEPVIITVEVLPVTGITNVKPMEAEKPKEEPKPEAKPTPPVEQEAKPTPPIVTADATPTPPPPPVEEKKEEKPLPKPDEKKPEEKKPEEKKPEEKKPEEKKKEEKRKRKMTLPPS
jgi:outer membrane biosynthesis protein TonB